MSNDRNPRIFFSLFLVLGYIEVLRKELDRSGGHLINSKAYVNFTWYAPVVHQNGCRIEEYVNFVTLRANNGA